MEFKLISDEEISKVLRACDYSMVDSRHNVEEPDSYKAVAKAQFQSCQKQLDEWLASSPEKVREEVKKILAIRCSEAWYADNADFIAKEICSPFHRVQLGENEMLAVVEKESKCPEVSSEQYSFYELAAQADMLQAGFHRVIRWIQGDS